MEIKQIHMVESDRAFRIIAFPLINLVEDPVLFSGFQMPVVLK